MMLIKWKALQVNAHTKENSVPQFFILSLVSFSFILTYHIIAEVCEEFIVMILVSAAAAATRIRLNIYDLWDEED